MKTLPTWKIAYAIVDGEYEYGDYILREAERMTEADAAAIVAAWWCGDGDPAEEEAFERALLEGYAVLPNDGRCITGLGWGRFSPIVVTVRNGCVESAAGVPDDVTVEVQDWDNGEPDAAGEPVPTVSEWTGPSKKPAGHRRNRNHPVPPFL